MDSAGEWSRLASRAFVPVEVSSHRTGFHGWSRVQRACGVVVSDLRADATHVVRRRPDPSDGGAQLCKVSLQVEGRSVLRQGGRETVLHPGEYTVYSADEPYDLHNAAGFRSVVLMFPRSALGLTDQQWRHTPGLRLAATAGSNRLTVPYLRQLAEDAAQLRGPVARRTRRTMLDLIATSVVEAVGGEGRLSSPTDPIVRWLDDHLAEPDLSPRRIAAAHYISPRKLQSMFREEGTSVSGWIRGRRLEACRRDLAEAHLSGIPIAAVARSWGFQDAAHFTRLFRQAFGTTPSDFRNRAHEQAGGAGPQG
ncbi:AraC-like ligand-binding domain-containing protein [Kineococcus sp. SYSU DK001]|uniref:AraC-like ligand-binding domain-containing protein n=1 Tax=Kineococcus sp. SYSU DK001 TaxID=3383122 RepID=UPI003D7D1CE8